MAYKWHEIIATGLTGSLGAYLELQPSPAEMNCVLTVIISLLFSFARANPIHEDARNRALFGLIKDDPEVDLDTQGMIDRWGYPVEKHAVTTEDGYILTIFRIPHGRNQTETPKGARPVVLIQHGFLGSSDIWVSNLPNHDAAFIFADAGNDVWLGNFRGNKYGRRHIRLSADDDYTEFFDFSWPEMSRYDLPAMIDQILKITGSSHVYYVGHSMGSLTMFVRLSQDKEFAKKVKRFYALAPVLKLENVKGLVRILSAYQPQFENLMSYAGIEEILPSTWLVNQFSQYLCGSSQYLGSTVCANTLFMIAGPDSLQLNQSRVPVYMAHTPAGTSRRTFAHLGQMVKNGLIGQYDHGARENKKRYGSETPPQYDVSTIETPIALYWGDSDWLATDKDIRKMIPKLKSVVSKTYLGEFNHMDFLWGSRAPLEIYAPICEDIKKDFHAGNDGPACEL